jgi:peptidoglycan/xylan/chitin deacetylase (PgdA/CDA1 family)
MLKSLGKVFRLLSTLFIELSLVWASFPIVFWAAKPQAAMGNVLPESQVDVRAYDINSRPLVSLTFDDASQTVYDVAFPTLNSHGIPATFYFMTSFLTDQWKTQLKSMENQGWEIGSHTRTHRDLTDLSPADLITELRQSKTDLEAAGLTVSGFAHPHGVGTRDAEILRQVKQYYAYARSAKPGYNTPIIEQYALKSQTQTASTSIEAMKGWVDSAIADKQWLIIMMHKVDNTGNTESISPADLSELASYIKAKADAGGISAVTVRDGITRYNQTDWQPIYDTNYVVQHNLVITNGRVLWFFGDEIVDYLNDGHEWVKSGQVGYYEWNGNYHKASVPSDVSLQSLSADRASVQFTLTDSKDGDFNVVSTVTLKRGSPLAEVSVTDIQGTAMKLSPAKYLTRRFSTNEGLLVTDGSIETRLRTFGIGSQSVFAFDSMTDLIRIMAQVKQTTFSEYSDFDNGEFRVKPISRTTELPYIWFVGGTEFDTLSLLSEAEDGTLGGGSSFYTGEDASPKTGNTGVVLDASNKTVTMQFTPPYTGNYVLSIRQKGSNTEDQYSYRIDGGQAVTGTVTGTSFGYDNIILKDISVRSHTLRVSQVEGAVMVDYVLLIPTSRSSSTPATVNFPVDVVRQVASNPGPSHH